MKRIKATLLVRWAKLTNTIVRQEPGGEWVRSDRDPRKPNIVTATVSKRYGQ